MERDHGKFELLAPQIGVAAAEKHRYRVAQQTQQEPRPVARFRIDKWRLVVVDDIDGRPSEQGCVGKIEVDGRRFFVLVTDVVTPDGRDSADLLTPRELQIARLVARGCPNKQIAFKLKISEWTVATHVRRILDKLGVDNRAAMVFRCSEIL
jgi:DNA-binding CsgD family transcriptional regulator